MLFSVNVQNPANCSNEVHVALCKAGDSTGDNSNSVKIMPMFMPISSRPCLPEIIISPAVVIPSHSGFPSKVDAFSKCGYFSKMVNACICPAIWLCQLLIQILEYLTHNCFFHAAFGYLTAVLLYCAIVLPYGCTWMEFFSKGEWELGIQKVTKMPWGSEEWREEGRIRGTEGGRKFRIMSFAFKEQLMCLPLHKKKMWQLLAPWKCWVWLSYYE